MTLCEMCGKETELVIVDVEGVELKVCSSCAKFGKVKKNTFIRSTRSFRHSSAKNDPPVFRVVHNYASLIRSVREQKKMSREDFSKFLNEKESVVAKWEAGNLKPRIAIARKLEKILGITLVEKEEETAVQAQKKEKSDVFTLGDFVKVRRRK